MSPRQNRVLPTGEIVARPFRGLFMGNRGILHDGAGRLGVSRWKHPHWVCCVLQFKNRHRQVMTPNHYTELFFLDEAVALAAGHRPCAECRRADFNAFRAALGPDLSAPGIDAALHPARVESHSRRQIRHDAPLDRLPDGTFILQDGTAHLVSGAFILPLARSGYGPARPRPRGTVTVLTPKPNLKALQNGYRPVLHPSAAQRL
jgi:hypothetical protein